jgi:oligopeptidase A
MGLVVAAIIPTSDELGLNTRLTRNLRIAPLWFSKVFMSLPALPAFAQLKPDACVAALDATLRDNRARLAQLLARPAAAQSWAGLIEPLDAMGEAVSRTWGPISHLFGVWSTPEWRAAYNEALPKLTEYSVELSQNDLLFNAYQALADASGFAAESPTRQKIVQDALRDFRLSGNHLPPDAKARYKEISLQLSKAQSEFEERVMDCVQAYSLWITDEAELDGMSGSAKSAAAAKAAAKNQQGWLLTLDFPSYDAVISHAKSRTLREHLYRAFATRASDQGEHAAQFDNSAAIEQILSLRQEQARMLGFRHYAELSLATKMADSVAEVEAFLLELADKARPFAERELAALKALAAQDGIDDFQAWDISYYSEKLREATLGLSDEALRPYFPMPQVLAGLNSLIERLYGLTIEALPTVETWHPDVTAWGLRHADGEWVGAFYLDPYARPETKRGGAWMDECLIRRRSLAQGLQLPVAYLVCNFTPPPATNADGSQDPSLLTHDEVLTLFHEFGHGLHHLLTQVDEAAASGIRGVEWDAVELPSQFMENFCYEPTTLKLFARHWQTGAAMPDAMIEQLRADRQFLSGLATLRQVEFSLFDLRLHCQATPLDTAGVLETLVAVRQQVALTQPPSYQRMPWSFGHIFAGGYAAGYYSYKWAEVLSSDAFSAFEESGFSAKTGHQFRDQILAVGSSRPAMDSFIAFRGRKPEVDALLRHSGMSIAG